MACANTGKAWSSLSPKLGTTLSARSMPHGKSLCHTFEGMGMDPAAPMPRLATCRAGRPRDFVWGGGLCLWAEKCHLPWGRGRPVQS